VEVLDRDVEAAIVMLARLGLLEGIQGS
jgi:hypothetical protein